MTVRSDLPYLRGRSLRSGSTSGLDTASASAPAYSTSEGLDLSAPAYSTSEVPAGRVAEERSGGAYRDPGTGTSLNLSASGLDTASASAPAYSTSEGGVEPAYSTSEGLDLSAPAYSTSEAGGTSLDLDAPSSAALPGALNQRSSRHSRPARHDLGLPTINADERRLLTETEPVVELTRMQSAAGALDAKVAVPNPSEVVLGIVFETSDSRESLVLPGLSQQGPDPRRPIFRATSSGVAVNLRRVTDIHRLLLFAVPTRPSKQMPGGTVTVTTYGGSRLELPLIAGPTLGAQALVSCYVVEGRLVLRAEHDPYSGTLQQVCAAYGYREISWRDPYTPLV